MERGLSPIERGSPIGRGISSRENGSPIERGLSIEGSLQEREGCNKVSIDFYCTLSLS